MKLISKNASVQIDQCAKNSDRDIRGVHPRTQFIKSITLIIVRRTAGKKISCARFWKKVAILFMISPFRLGCLFGIWGDVNVMG